MRTEDPVWRCYGDKIKDPQLKCAIRRCKGCGFQCSLVTSRAKNHANQCGNLRQMGLWSVTGGSRLDNHLVTTSLTGQAKTNVLLAKFIFSSNLPFQVLKDQHFRTLLETLRPGTKVPERRTLAGPLLDQVYDEVRSASLKAMHGEWKTMACDGWTNPSGVSCIGLSLDKDLWSICDTGTESHTGKNMATIVIEALAEVESHGCFVAGLCTDGASNMTAMRTLVSEQKPGFPPPKNHHCGLFHFRITIIGHAKHTPCNCSLVTFLKNATENKWCILFFLVCFFALKC